MTSSITFSSTPWVACGLLAAAASNPALAQSSAPARALLDNSFVFNLGTFIVNSDVKASLNGQSAQNPEVDFDKTFGKDNNASRVRADALWRVTPAHQLRLMYFDNSRNSTRAIDEAVKWGDYTYQVGATVASEFKSQTAALAYEYAFLHEPTYEVAASLGVHYSKLSMRLTGTASVTDSNGNVSVVQGATRQESVPAPLPVIGLRAGWMASPQWYLEGHGQFFKVNVNGLDGSWSDLRAAATWMYSPNFGVGLGYDRFYNHVDVSKGSFDGRLKYGYSGLQLYLTGTF